MWIKCLTCVLTLLWALPALADQLDGTLTWNYTEKPGGAAARLDVQQGLNGTDFSTVSSLPPTARSLAIQQDEGIPTYWRVVAVNMLGQAASDPTCATIVRGQGVPLLLTLPSPVSGPLPLAPPLMDLVGITYQIDGVNVAPEVTTPPYLPPSVDSTTLPNGAHTLTEILRSSNGVTTTLSTTFIVQNGTPTPALLYTFDEGTGATTVDSSGNNNTGSVVGATWIDGPTSKALAFTAAGMRVITPVTDHALVRTYLFRFQQTGTGGGDFGRFFDKRVGGAEVEALYGDKDADTGKATIKYLRHWSSGDGSWTIPAPPLNTWHSLAVVYDASAAANKPKIYLDGVTQVVKTVLTPKGTPVANSDPYVLGNRGNDGARWMGGALDRFEIHNRALLDTEIQAWAAVK